MITAASKAPGIAPPRIVISHLAPTVDHGEYPAKRCVGDVVEVSADIFRDGHDRLKAMVRYRPVGSDTWGEREMHQADADLGGVRWAGFFAVDAVGRWEFEVTAWTDRFETWRDELSRKIAANQPDRRGELSEGVVLLQEIARRAELEDREAIDDALRDGTESALMDERLRAAAERAQPRSGSAHAGPLTLVVDRRLAGIGAWYELFPRSWGGLKGVEQQLPELSELGFDVVYLPPIHPIGHTNRKGRNNALTAQPGDPGSPWSIGDETGGHDAVHSELGTTADLRSLTRTAAVHGIEIALDFAINCSPDHPWLKEHPEWFHRRPDGTLKYAENPPKRYQDIYNVNWESEDWQGLWNALLEVVLHWVDCGVSVFRVDNPHTKPSAFWEWLIEEVHTRDPDVVFLAEAFTRRQVMRHLAKIGFSQSYTYFTWKNTRWELTEYLTELTTSGEQEYFRPNFFANTPDILHEYLQDGGRPAFEARLILASTLSPSYGIYSGFENCENVAVAAGSEEYLNSEKYEIRNRSLDGVLLPLVATLNHARRNNPALQKLDNLTFLDTANEQLLAYLKRTNDNAVITVVNLDPHNSQEGLAIIPESLGLPADFTVTDLLTGERFSWRSAGNYVRFDPGTRQGHVNRVEPESA
jgi:starch synthase (maltosyl-transferring)